MKTGFDEVKRQIAAGAGFVPVVQEIAFPSAGPEQVFRGLSSRTGGAGSGEFFFETSSVGGGKGVCYIGLDPFEVLRVKRGRLEVASTGVTKTLADSRAIAQEIGLSLARFRAFRLPNLPAFQGGAFGSISYDFARHLEPRLKKSGYFRDLDETGDGLDAELMFFHKLLIFDRASGRAYAIAGVVTGGREVSEGELRERYVAACADLDELKALAAEAPAAKPFMADAELELSFESLATSLGPERFEQGVKSLKEGIAAGDIFQAVLSDRFTVNLASSADDVFQALGQVSPAPYRFHLRVGGRDLLGASPEMLIRVDSDVIETHPIAGTRRRGASEQEEKKLERQLLRSPKERAEHLMLVDLARNDVGRVARPGSVKVTNYREVLKFGGVMHLVSRVQGLLQEGRSAFEAFAACFPAGTLSGAPKVRAIELIAEIERVPRGFYGGAIVAASFAGDLDSCIAIRTMSIENGVATLQAGAGVVADSRADREYAEIKHKTCALRQAIALAERNTKTRYQAHQPQALQAGGLR